MSKSQNKAKQTATTQNPRLTRNERQIGHTLLVPHLRLRHIDGEQLTPSYLSGCPYSQMPLLVCVRRIKHLTCMLSVW